MIRRTSCGMTITLPGHMRRASSAEETGPPGSEASASMAAISLGGRWTADPFHATWSRAPSISTSFRQTTDRSGNGFVVARFDPVRHVVMRRHGHQQLLFGRFHPGRLPLVTGEPDQLPDAAPVGLHQVLVRRSLEPERERRGEDAGIRLEPGQDVVVEPAKEPVVRPLSDHSAEEPDQHLGTVPNGADRARGYPCVRPVNSNEIAEPTAA